MRVFKDAQAGLPLSPAQRAFLKLVEGFLMSAFVACLPVFAQLLAGQNVDLVQALKTGAGAFAVALLLAMSKYYKAHGDTLVGQALDTAAGELREFAGIPNDVKIEPQVDGSDAGSDSGAAPQVPAVDLPAADQPAQQPISLND